MDEIAELLGFMPEFPRDEDIDPQRIILGYNDEADMFYIHFYGKVLPSTSVDVTRFVYLMVDMVTRRVVGLQIQGFLIRAVREDPRLLEFASAAGLSDDEIEAIRRSIEPSKRQQVALRSLLGELAASAVREPATRDA